MCVETFKLKKSAVHAHTLSDSLGCWLCSSGGRCTGESCPGTVCGCEVNLSRHRHMYMGTCIWMPEHTHIFTHMHKCIQTCTRHTCMLMRHVIG